MTTLIAIQGRLTSVRPRLRSSIILFVVLGISKVMALLSSVIVARSFDKDVSGVIFFVTGIVTLSVAVTTLGLTASASYHYARNLYRGRFSRNWQTFNFALVVAVAPSIVLALLALTMEEARGELAVYIVPVLAISCFMAAARQMAKMFFTIEKKREWSLVHDSITYNIGLVVCILALWGAGPVAGLAAVLVASVTSGLFSVWHLAQLLRRDGRGPFNRHFPPRRYASLLIAISIPSMVAQGSAIILNKIDIVMLGPLSDAAQVGDYSVAMRMTYLAGIISEVVNIFMAPRIIAAGASRDPAAHWRIFKLSFALQAASVAVISVPLMVFASDIVTLLFGAAYQSAVPTYLILQAGKLLTVAFAPSILLFTSLGYNREMAKVAVVVAILNIVLNLALIPLWGAVGTATATLISLALMAVNYVRISHEIYTKASRVKSAGPTP
ncbi:oligosaccharide flippase family protein [Affinirhizobium pseudoryzae]|uniref:oligosaccharide flippase family protein n=1 Tax=Allorhizobium pseudoryzae TaxID=379684 RepID=UPI0013ED8024|nr:oligosaccharide flippase family protein [Allorhizobium pseudoryzae]